MHQRVGAAEVGHQPERRLGHAELHVVGDDAQVAGQRELEAGADGVAVHGGDGDPVRVAQPAEAGLEAGDGGVGVRVGQLADAGDAGLPVDLAAR